MEGPSLNPCASCGKHKVLKPGDYCRSCAIISDLPDGKYEYVILSRAMLDIAAEKSGMAREFLVAKMDLAFEHNQQYIIFRTGEQWHDILIHDRFPVPVVMKRLFERLE